MIRKRNFIIWAGVLLGGFIFGSRIVHFVREPEMKVEIARSSRAYYEMEGWTFSKRLQDGELRVYAQRALPGHLTVVKFFKFGPSTFINVSGIKAQYSGDRGERWEVQGEKGRIKGDLLEVDDLPVEIDGAGGVKEYKHIRLDLRTGKITRNAK